MLVMGPGCVRGLLGRIVLEGGGSDHPPGAKGGPQNAQTLGGKEEEKKAVKPEQEPKGRKWKSLTGGTSVCFCH
ncbi:hypothetical protein JRQ81_007969 [Phrynocephalus forsythii]|uniref:Uncharacterized protein n=1 Tax=Phrynocephalus forsythii TaxID=171643 RepID=A0A9Q1AT66_9SAUR|nr:hypothetical protein JRQ81_007969 [Phrynocephalus forsythii]